MCDVASEWKFRINNQQKQTTNERTKMAAADKRRKQTEKWIIISCYQIIEIVFCLWFIFILKLVFPIDFVSFLYLYLFVFYFVSVTWSSFSFLCSSFFCWQSFSLSQPVINSIAIHIGHYASTWNKLICFFYPKQIWYFGNRRLEYEKTDRFRDLSFARQHFRFSTDICRWFPLLFSHWRTLLIFDWFIWLLLFCWF